MKIGINARFLAKPYTGIGQYSYNLLQALSKIDHENEYLLFTTDLVDIPLSEQFRQIRVPEKEFQSPSLKAAHWKHVLLPQEMKKWNVNLAHYLYPSNTGKSIGVPVVVTVHDVIPWVLPAYSKRFRSKITNFMTKSAIKKADHIITVSEFSKEEIMRVMKIDKKKITVTHLAPPLGAESDLPEGLALRRDYLLYVGGYDERKNIPALLDAYQKHIANHYAIDLVLVGAENQGLEQYITDKYCERVAGKYPVKPKGSIVFTPHLLSGELASLYKHAKALVHPSFYEGFNLPLVEAMAAGIPIICSDIPVNHEVTEENAYFMDPTNADTIGIGIHEFLNNKKLQHSITKGGALRCKDFSWEKCAEETLAVYNQLT